MCSPLWIMVAKFPTMLYKKTLSKCSLVGLSHRAKGCGALCCSFSSGADASDTLMKRLLLLIGAFAKGVVEDCAPL